MRRHIRKIKEKIAIEICLLSRLKILAYVLYGLSLISFSYELFHSHSPSQETSSENLVQQEELFAPDISPHDAFNFFVIALIFFLIGSLCFYISRKRNKLLRKKKK